MASAAQLPVTDQRRSSRHPVNHRLVAENRRLGDIPLRLCNISSDGFMTAQATGLARGERLVVRLPHVGRIEAHLAWTLDERAGFQFERIIRGDDLALMLASLERDDKKWEPVFVDKSRENKESRA